MSGTRIRFPLTVLSYLAFAGLLVAWFLTLAPTTLGGPATFALVDGHSMEPMLHTGDLAVARSERSGYSVGDLVVYRSEGGGLIIHRLVSGAASAGWTTKGDHNQRNDPWTVPDSAILGKYAFEVPRVGYALGWVNTHTWMFALACTLLALTFYLPLRRQRLSPLLVRALKVGQEEPRREGRSNQEYGVLVTSAVASLAALALVGLLGTSHQLVTLRGLVAGIALLWAGGFTLHLVYRLYDGRGVAEPSKSMYALSGRLHLVSELPALDCEVQDVRSAVALRTIAEKYRLPVLHTIDPDTRQHAFLLITVQQGCLRWAPQPALAASSSSGDSFGGTRPPLGPRGRHSALTSNPGSGATFRTRPVSVPLVGGALTTLGAGTLLGHESVRPWAVASVAGFATGLAPRGRHAARSRRSLRSRLLRAGSWSLAASLVTVATLNADWVSANRQLVMVAGGAMAAVVAGALVYRFAPDEAVPHPAGSVLRRGTSISSLSDLLH